MVLGMIEIKHRVTGKILAVGPTVKEAVEQAIEYHVVLDGADLRGVDLSGADLRYGRFHGAWLAGANLMGANLDDADFVGADFTGACLSGATLVATDLTDAVVAYANLISADLSDAATEVQGLDRSPRAIAGIAAITKIARVLGEPWLDPDDRRTIVGLIGKWERRMQEARDVVVVGNQS